MRRVTIDPPPVPPARRRARVKPRIGPAIRRHAAACVGFALLGLGFWQAHEEGFFDQGVDHAVDRFTDISAKLGFTVEEIIVEGRRETSHDDLRNALGLAHGTPMFAFDAGIAHERLKAIPWVRWAVIERRLPDIVALQIIERKPIALWQKDGQFSLIDAEGAVIPIDDIVRFNTLPVVVGEGAAPYAKGLIDMLASEPDMARRVRWAVRVGERRWDLHLEDRIVVRLPEDGALDAWRRLVELERGHGLFARNYSIIDLRLKDRVIVRKVPDDAESSDPNQRNT